MSTTLMPTGYAAALRLLRTLAEQAPGQWKSAAAKADGVVLGWWVDPDSRDEKVRLTRQVFPPYAGDLEAVAANLPPNLAIGPIEVDRDAHTLTLGLRPGRIQVRAERCIRCGASPRWGTRLFGDDQLCAPCTCHPPDRTGTEGSALIAVLLLVVTLGLLVGGVLQISGHAERIRSERMGVPVTESAANDALEVMSQRIRSLAQTSGGVLTQAHIDALNAELGSAPLPASSAAPLDMAETGYRLVRVQETAPIDDNADVLDVWTDMPRRTWFDSPRPQGLMASHTYEVEMRARARGQSPTGDIIAQRTRTRAIKIGKVMPHQHALYSAGRTDFCASATPVNDIGGPVRVDGTAVLGNCAHSVNYGGTMEVRDAVQNLAPAGRHNFRIDGTSLLPIGSWNYTNVLGNTSALLRATVGHLRLPPAWGGTHEITRFQTAEIAGTGECIDRSSACGGNGYFAPSIAIQRTNATGGSNSVTCGVAYPGNSCNHVIGAAFGYHPWNPQGPVTPGVAARVQGNPNRLWRGIFPDGRRELRCTATMGPNVYRTHRCPSNPHGFLLNLGNLPAVTGGLLYVRRSANPSAGAAAVGSQEMLVIHNAERLAGPLHLVSELPVAIAGSLNTRSQAAWRGPPPLMIDAPRIVLLPAEAVEQVGNLGTGGWAAVWDSVPSSGPAGSATPSALPITAVRNVTIFGVLRTRTCETRGTTYFGGSWEGAPMVLGDWRRAGLRIVGAVETVVDEALSTASCQAMTGTMLLSGVGANGTPIYQPNHRTLLHDPRLLHPQFRIPGSYSPANIPPGGITGIIGRTPTRQANAVGGSTVAWVTRESGPRAARPAVAFPAIASQMPVAPAPLP